MVKIDQRGFSILQIIIVLALVMLIGTIGNFLIKKANSTNRLDPDDYVKESQVEPPMEEVAASPDSTELANPASTNCVNKGGQVVTKTLPSGGQYGVCLFKDDRECEEWTLYRGQCPDGGVKTIGYDTPEEIFCVIFGGKTTATKNPTCAFNDGSTCSALAYYNGTCSVGQSKRN